jgi:Nitrite and sulphite reductase 4Fe-4S domain
MTCPRRNVLCSAIPSLSELHAQVYAFAKSVSEHLLPRTTAYHEIWLDKKLVAGEALKDFEPLYGEFYLPRKVCLMMIFIDKYLITFFSLKLLLQSHQLTISMSSPTTSASSLLSTSVASWLAST